MYTGGDVKPVCKWITFCAPSSSRVLWGGNNRSFPPNLSILFGFPDLLRDSALFVTTDCIVAMRCNNNNNNSSHDELFFVFLQPQPRPVMGCACMLGCTKDVNQFHEGMRARVRTGDGGHSEWFDVCKVTGAETQSIPLQVCLFR